MRISSCLATVPLLLLGVVRPALAAPGETTVSLGLDYVQWRRAIDLPGMDDAVDFWGHGARLTLETERGFSDAFWWHGQVNLGATRADGEAGVLASATVGVTYAFDVLKYVPLVHLGAGASLTGGGRVDVEVTPVVALDGGLIILRSRTRSWGVIGGVEIGASGLWQLNLGLRYGWRWGTF
jgi:hypothetical protein